jgi:hypothetical protein
MGTEGDDPNPHGKGAGEDRRDLFFGIIPYFFLTIPAYPFLPVGGTNRNPDNKLLTCPLKPKRK